MFTMIKKLCFINPISHLCVDSFASLLLSIRRVYTSVEAWCLINSPRVSSSLWLKKESVQFSSSVVSDSLWLHGPQHARLPCPSPTSGAGSNSCPLNRWCHPTISSSVVPFSSCLQSFPASGSFPMSQFFTSGGRSIGVISVPYFKINYSWDSLRNFLKFTVKLSQVTRPGFDFKLLFPKFMLLTSRA